MSAYRENVRAFIQVYQAGLIPEPHKQDLQNLVVNLPESDDLVCDELDKWLKEENRGQILTAYEDKLKAILAESDDKKIVLGPGYSRPTTLPNEPDETLKEQLNNAIQPASIPSNPSGTENR